MAKDAERAVSFKSTKSTAFADRNNVIGFPLSSGIITNRADALIPSLDCAPDLSRIIPEPAFV